MQYKMITLCLGIVIRIWIRKAIFVCVKYNFTPDVKQVQARARTRKWNLFRWDSNQETQKR